MPVDTTIPLRKTTPEGDVDPAEQAQVLYRMLSHPQKVELANAWLGFWHPGLAPTPQFTTNRELLNYLAQNPVFKKAFNDAVEDFVSEAVLDWLLTAIQDAIEEAEEDGP